MNGRRTALRRSVALLVLQGLVGGTSRAEDGDRHFGWSVPAPASARSRGQPVDAVEWERRGRGPQGFGPLPVRPADARLIDAVRGGDWAAALQLLRQGGASAGVRDERGINLLVPTARSGPDELLREMLKRGAELDRVDGESGFTALGAAAFHGRRSTVRLLLAAGADPRRWGSSGQTPLHLASLAGHVPVIDELLAQGVAVETLNRGRESALDVAAGAGRDEAMDRLLQAGADMQRAGRR